MSNGKTKAFDADALKAARDATANAIEKLKAVSVSIGSDEAYAASCALDYLGLAYYYLTPSDDNPAWS